jgi:hypothetical protein
LKCTCDINMQPTCNENNVDQPRIEYDDSNCLADTSTICTVSDSIQLSLPESFDDTFSLNGISIAPDRCSNAEIRLLHAQLRESRREVQQLTADRDATFNSLKNLEIAPEFDEKYHNVKRIPAENRSLVQHATFMLYDKLSNHQKEYQQALVKAKNASDIADQQKEKAQNVQILCDQKVSNLEEAVDAANERRSELEEKCKGLQATIIEIQEKGRKFDDLTSQNQDLINETKRLRTIIDQRRVDSEKIIKENICYKDKVKDLNRKVQVLEMDKSFMEKEKCMLLQRVETDEERTKSIESALRDATLKCDTLTMQLGDASLVAKADSEVKAGIEIKRIREESGEELKRYRSQVEASYTRELNILREAKDEATKQNIEDRNNIEKLRQNLENTTTQKDEMLSRLERSLSDCRSDIKVKCIETSRLQLHNEQLEQSNKAIRHELQMLSDQVKVHKTEFTNLEQESLSQRKHFEDEIERKEEQLEMYYQSQIKNTPNRNVQSAGPYSPHLNNQVHFLDKAKQVEKKNSDLQKALTHLKNELSKQVEKTKSYQTKLTSADLKIHSLSKQIKVSEDKQLMENDASNHLVSQIHALKEDLQQARKERDKLGKEFSFLLEKYHQLIEQNRENGYFSASGTTPLRSKRVQKNIQVWTVDSQNKKATPTKMTHHRDSVTMHTTHQASLLG